MPDKSVGPHQATYTRSNIATGGFTGRNGIFLDDKAVQNAKAELQAVSDKTINELKDDLRAKIKEMNNCAGISKVGGKIDAEKLVGLVDYSTEGITSILAQIDAKVESMKAYDAATDAEIANATVKMFASKFTEGFIGSFEEIGDGAIVLGTYFFGTKYDEWAKKRLERNFASEVAGKMISEEEKKISAFTEDSGAANLTKGFGTVVGYVGMGALTGGVGGLATKGVGAAGKATKVTKAVGTFLSNTRKAEVAVAAVGGLGSGTSSGLRQGKTLEEARWQGVSQAGLQAGMAVGAFKLVDNFAAGSKAVTTSDDVLKGDVTDPLAVQNRIDDVTGVNQNAAAHGAPSSADDSMFSIKNTADDAWNDYQARNSMFSPTNTSDDALKAYQTKNNTAIQNRIDDATGVNQYASSKGAPTSADDSMFSAKNTPDDAWSKYQARNSSFSSSKTSDDVFKQYQTKNNTAIQNRIDDATGVNQNASGKGAPTSADDSMFSPKNTADDAWNDYQARNSAFSPENTSDEVFNAYQKRNGLGPSKIDNLKDAGKTVVEKVITKDNIAYGTAMGAAHLPQFGSESAASEASVNLRQNINEFMADEKANNIFDPDVGEDVETKPGATGGGTTAPSNNATSDNSSNNKDKDSTTDKKDDGKDSGSDKKDDGKDSGSDKKDDGTDSGSDKKDDGKDSGSDTGDDSGSDKKDDGKDSGGGTGGGSGGGGTHYTGGGYSGSQGYVSQNGEAETDSTIEDILDDSTTSIDDVIKGSNYNKIPTSTDPITSKSSGGSMVIPIAAGLSAAAAAGIGAKAYLDRKNNNDNGETDDIETEDWENQETIDLEYAEDVEKEQFLDEDDEFGYQEEEPAEKYGARSSQEIADLQ